MVRREEQPWQARARVLLDTRGRPPTAARGRARRSSGRSPRPPRSALHLVRHGYAVRLLTDTGAQRRAAPTSASTARGSRRRGRAARRARGDRQLVQQRQPAGRERGTAPGRRRRPAGRRARLAATWRRPACWPGCATARTAAIAVAARRRRRGPGRPPGRGGTGGRRRRRARRPAAGLRLAGAAGPGRRPPARPVARRRSARRGQSPGHDGRLGPGAGRMQLGSLRMAARRPRSPRVTATLIASGRLFLTGVLVLADACSASSSSAPAARPPGGVSPSRTAVPLGGLVALLLYLLVRYGQRRGLARRRAHAGSLDRLGDLASARPRRHQRSTPRRSASPPASRCSPSPASAWSRSPSTRSR